MKCIAKLLFTLVLILVSNFTFSQQAMTPERAQQIALSKSDTESMKSSQDYLKKLEDEQKRLKKEQNKTEKYQKDLKSAQKDIEKTSKKIEKLEAQNQKVSNRITTSTLSVEDAQKQQIKLKENELEIQKLKLKKIDQQKKLEKISRQS
ncbi:hypothetical protein [Flavobacterium branchiicola]|uniref:Peptidase M23 n=1 Tax=Flavobacterium branchiicola TaxID=1114875 RepID=A0ABV9PJI0_9FLAO|nr:hypothetical protein [Flavobacterium branchiicola]MBS7255230.1 hypothetical protein [Flavobacterium branchiicola]